MMPTSGLDKSNSDKSIIDKLVSAQYEDQPKVKTSVVDPDDSSEQTFVKKNKVVFGNKKK